MTNTQALAIISRGRLQQNRLSAMGDTAFDADGEATCLAHREPIKTGERDCARCRRAHANEREAAERFADLMRQGIWKGSTHRRR